MGAQKVRKRSERDRIVWASAYDAWRLCVQSFHRAGSLPSSYMGHPLETPVPLVKDRNNYMHFEDRRQKKRQAGK